MPALSLPCPRCGGALEQRFYGPCGRCREELVGRLGGGVREVERPAYEPKANVVANHVATKD